MRLLLLALPALILGLRLGAAEHLLPVTPQTLAGWSVAGAEKNALASGQQLSLPAGAQLSREFSASAVIVHLVSRPVLAETSAEWPILEIGPVALALTGREGQGRLVLVVNADHVIDLPWPVVPDPAHPAVDLILAYDPVTGAGLVGLKDQIKPFAGASSAQPVAVILSAGEHAAWPQDSLSVLLLAADPPPPVARSGGNGGSTSSRAATARLKTALDHLSGPAATATPGGPAAPATTAAPEPAPVSTLEIFTPPAVRRGRAEAVRALLARTPGN